MLSTLPQQPRTVPQPPRPPRQGQQTVFARLQSLFPASPGTAAVASFPPNDLVFPSPKLHSSRRLPKFLKIRILTWNMHDSLPKGDLEELLGAVSPHEHHRRGPDDSPSFPALSTEPVHPYHLLVVAGQECPSSSGKALNRASPTITHGFAGIPMGLGAGIKLGVPDKEKDRDKSDDKDYDKFIHHLQSLKRKDKERDEATRGWKSSDDLPDEFVVSFNHSGWTPMLEHWLCHRTQANPQVQADHTLKDITSSPKRHSLHRRVTVKESEMGPYVPLVKERMMGLYLSIYIHRELRGLVEGFSKSAVTAGLIGGRVGNKGGVGISLKIDGSTFLFLNAHLAAHEGKVHHRLANLAKIKSELAVDDFLQPNDPRMLREDITDRFDYTFLCGDLNFRLDITRLHADWLISRQDYAQAFAFDQLKRQMETNSAFSGFKEAPINFPPTFKYNVASRSKTKRRRSRRSPMDGNETEREEEENGDDIEDERSLASSGWTTHSKGVASEPEDDDYFTTFAPNSTVGEGGRAPLAITAQKAKAKWKALLSPAVAKAPPTWLRRKRSLRETASRCKSPDIVENPPSSGPSTEDLPSSPIELPSETTGLLEPPNKQRIFIPRRSSRGFSTKSVPSTPVESHHNDDDDIAVYDSSHKQRVPSWCDRILWKSTVKPDEAEQDVAEMRQRTRVGALISQAMRPFSVRVRRDSGGSPNSTEVSCASKQDYFSRPAARISTSSRPLSLSIPKPPWIPGRNRSTESVDQAQDDSHTSLRPPTQGSDDSTRVSSTDASAHKASGLAVDSPSLPSVSVTRGDSSLSECPPPVPPKDPMPTPPASTRWRFFPFRRDTFQSVATQESAVSTVTLAPHPGKGDVICLKYSSLNDRGMRLLEGRSDHRPVIGSYAVYL